MLVVLLTCLAGQVAVVWGHFDHGVGGERLVFQIPPPIDLQRQRDGVLRFDPPAVIHVPHSSALNIGSATIAAWVWVDSAYVGTSPGVVAGRWHQIQGESSFVLHSDGSEAGGFRVTWEDGSELDLWGYDVPVSRWVHYAATIDDSEMVVYVDGVAAARTDVNGKRLADSLCPLWIGGSTEGVVFPGMIADVRLVARAADEQDIGHLMAGENVEGEVGRWLAGSRVDDGVRVVGSLRWVDDPARGGGADFRNPHQTELKQTDSASIEGEITLAAWAINRGIARGGGAVVGKWGPDLDERSFILYSVGGDGFGFRAFWETVRRVT